MGPRRVTPASVVAGEGVIRRAEICGCDQDGGAAGVAPGGVVGALDLEAGAAAEAVVEEGRA